MANYVIFKGTERFNSQNFYLESNKRAVIKFCIN
jgi:hypothetical protein